MKDLDLRGKVSDEKDLEIIKAANPELAALLSVYPEEAVDKLTKNKNKLLAVAKKFDKLLPSNTVNAMIMTCNSTCPYSSVCILRANDMDPIGLPCPVEKKMALELEYDIVKSLEIQKDDPIEMELLWDLIDTKLLDMRSSGALKNGDLVQRVEMLIAGQMVGKDEVSPLVLIKMDLKKIKHSIMDAFIGTRRSKKKYGMSAGSSALEEIIAKEAMKLSNNNSVDGEFSEE